MKTHPFFIKSNDCVYFISQLNFLLIKNDFKYLKIINKINNRKYFMANKKLLKKLNCRVVRILNTEDLWKSPIKRLIKLKNIQKQLIFKETNIPKGSNKPETIGKGIKL